MVSRRQVLAGLGAVAVFGFDPVTRTWGASAQAAGLLDRLPQLDGTLVTDPTSLAPYATDVGSAIHNTPVAVLRPGSVEDIAKMVRYCRRHCIHVAARGQGHTTFGQSQVAAGLVVDMGSLNKIHSISATRADVDAGATWRMLVDASVPLGFVPPVLTGYIKLSIGGTLSVGGVSSTNRQGCQVDRVQELEVVTGEGEVKRCSEHQNRDLFEAVLGGLGQCGIITRAIVDMMPAPSSVRNFVLTYTDNAAFFKDLRVLLNRGEATDISCIWQPDATGRLIYGLNVAGYYGPSAAPTGAQLLRGLTQPASAAIQQDQAFYDYAIRVDLIFDFFQSIGLFDGVLHPWFDAWLPNETVERYVGEVIPTLTPEDIGPTGFLLLFPQKRSKLNRRFLEVPDCTDWVFLFDILTANAAPGPDPAFQAKMLDRNNRLFEKARRAGGTRYPIGSLQFDKRDWKQQYGDDWSAFKRAKGQFDPDNILTPGPGIF
ncbi:MAG: FAD-binding protein [Myxococcales bacterium]